MSETITAKEEREIMKRERERRGKERENKDRKNIRKSEKITGELKD